MLIWGSIQTADYH